MSSFLQDAKPLSDEELQKLGIKVILCWKMKIFLLCMFVIYDVIEMFCYFVGS